MESCLLPFQLSGLKIWSLGGSLKVTPPLQPWFTPPESGCWTLLPPSCFKENPTPPQLLIVMPTSFSGSFLFILLQPSSLQSGYSFNVEIGLPFPTSGKSLGCVSFSLLVKHINFYVFH